MDSSDDSGSPHSYDDVCTPADVRRWDRQTDNQHALPSGTEVLPREDEPVESFLEELERRMLTGHSAVELRRWATRELKLPKATYDRYVEIVRAHWKLETTTHYASQQRRDELRAMYRHVYHKAMSAQSFSREGVEMDTPELLIALKAVDSMAKLDGLAMPDVALLTPNQGAVEAANATVTQLTNRTRERTMELLRLARERAEVHAAKTTRVLEERRETFDVEDAKVMGVVR